METDRQFLENDNLNTISIIGTDFHDKVLAIVEPRKKIDRDRPPGHRTRETLRIPENLALAGYLLSFVNYSSSVIFFSPPRGYPKTPETLHTLRASILVDRAGFEPAAFRSLEENIPPCEPDVLRPRQPTTAQHTRLNYRPNPTSARPRNHLKDFRHRQDLPNPENVNTRQSPARKTNGPVAQHG